MGKSKKGKTLFHLKVNEFAELYKIDLLFKSKYPKKIGFFLGGRYSPFDPLKSEASQKLYPHARQNPLFFIPESYSAIKMWLFEKLDPTI